MSGGAVITQEPPPSSPEPDDEQSRPATIASALGFLRGNVRQYGMIVALVAIIVLFQVLTDGILLRPLNVTNVIMQNSYILVLAIGMMLVIINGHIDLSVGSVAALVGAVAGVTIVQWGWSWWAVTALCLVIGGAIGAWQGFWVAYVRIPSFIVTLAGLLIFRGLTLVALKGQSIAPFPSPFRSLGSGFLPDLVPGSDVHVLTLLLGALATLAVVLSEVRTRSSTIGYGLPVVPLGLFITKLIALAVVINVFMYVVASYEGLPIVGIMLVALIVAYAYITNRTVLGRHIYAVGGNEKAALLSGVKTRDTTFWVFVNMGVLSALAGLIFTARLNAATPRAGTLFELDAIAAAFIGGASMAGGVGTIVGAIIGGLVMGVLNNGMSLMGVAIDWQQFIKGMVLLLAVAFDVWNKNRVR